MPTRSGSAVAAFASTVAFTQVSMGSKQQCGMGAVDSMDAELNRNGTDYCSPLTSNNHAQVAPDVVEK
jgi:hypothetical protein